MPRLFLAPTPPGHETLVHFAQKAVAQRKALAYASHAMFQGSDVIGNFYGIIKRCTRRLLQLEEKKVGERRLGALDLAWQDSLPTHISVEEKLRLGQ
jgi:hypothetical protein